MITHYFQTIQTPFFDRWNIIIIRLVYNLSEYKFEYEALTMPDDAMTNLKIPGVELEQRLQLKVILEANFSW